MFRAEIALLLCFKYKKSLANFAMTNALAYFISQSKMKEKLMNCPLMQKEKFKCWK